MRTLLFLLLSFNLFGQLPIASFVSQQRTSTTVSPTIIRSIDADFNEYQRLGAPFTIENNSLGSGTFVWQALNISDDDPANWSVEEQQTATSPTWDLPLGHYAFYVSTQGLNPDPVARYFINQTVTVLPALFTEGEADRVLSLDDGNNIFDASSWTDGEQIFLKKIDATVGRIRIDNYTSATQAHLLIDPSSEMEVNSFVGSHGLYLVNCQNLLIDAVGTTDAYGLYLNGVGDNTSHGINLNLVSDIRCENIEIYGVKINVPQSGASGIRMLGDESATYNRGDPPLQHFRFAHIWIVNAGHEGGYWGYTDDTDGGNGGPRQFQYLRAWDWVVDETGRDPIQPCNQIDAMIWDWSITSAGTLEEPSHNSYISHNSGNQNVKIFNIRAKGGMHPISIALGTTGTNPMIWNCVFEGETLPSQSSWNFFQTDAGSTTDAAIMNVTFVANTGDEIVYRFDASGGNTRDIDDFTLINCTTIKGTSANFFTKDGTNPETSWDRTSGNLTYIPATSATALLDGTTRLPSSVSCPSINGGVAWTTRRTAAETLSDFGTLEFQFDVDGYVVGLDGEYPSGAGSGMELKLNDL